MITNDERHKIEDATHRELCKSFAKHGDWEEMEYRDMFAVISGELAEAVEAWSKNDHFGPHGMLIELAQVGACCQKMAMQILRRNRMPSCQ